MAHINLLPWREAQRAQQKKQYILTLVMVVLVMLAINWLVASFINQLITNQTQRNQFLEGQIAILDGEISKIRDIKDSKKAVEQRMGLIEQLQASRNAAPHIMDELAKILPPGVSFQTMTRSGNRIEILGVSESNNRLSEFMRRLEQSKVFTNGVLSSITADEKRTESLSDFKLTFNVSQAIAPEVVDRLPEAKK